MGMTQRDSFTLQCDLIKTAFNCDTVIMGDLNLDYNKKYDVNYSGCHLFEILDEKMLEFNFLQLVNFDTWFRTVGNVNRSSLLDHIYVSNVKLISNVNHVKPFFGDHELIIASLCIERPQPTISVMRDWRRYSKELLCSQLNMVIMLKFGSFQH